MSFIGNPYSPSRLDEAVLDTKLNKIAQSDLDMNGYNINSPSGYLLTGHIYGLTLSNNGRKTRTLGIRNII